jgi:hypothetical protein
MIQALHNDAVTATNLLAASLAGAGPTHLPAPAIQARLILAMLHQAHHPTEHRRTELAAAVAAVEAIGASSKLIERARAVLAHVVV